MSVFQEWTNIINKKQVHSELVKDAYADLTTHGLTLYSEIMCNFVAAHLNSEVFSQIQSKNEEKAYRELFERTNRDFTRLLREHVRTFNDNLVASLHPKANDMSR